MRLSFPNLPDLGRVVVAVKNVRWRDPLVQVWGLIGVVLMTGMVTYYVRRTGAGEQKNAWWADALLANGTGTEDWQPEVCFSEPVSPTPESSPVSATAREEFDLRDCANKAAHRKAWRFLTADLRHQMGRLGSPVKKVVVTWSGTRGGDAKALDLYYASVRDNSAGAPGDFVIGNGIRSRDGNIEITGRWSAAGAESPPEELRICLAGDSTRPTLAQKEALGELISFIEARSGAVTLSLHTPAAPGLLANRD